MPKIALATSLRPAPTSPASATISPARTLNEMSSNTPSRVRLLDRSTTSARLVPVFGYKLLRSRPIMARMMVVDGQVAGGADSTKRPSRMTVTLWQMREDVLEPMRDEQYRRALRAQRRDDPEKALDLDGGQRRGRLVHDHTRALNEQRLGDLDDLLVGD